MVVETAIAGFRPYSRRLRVEEARGSIGRETRSVGSGTAEMMRRTGAAARMGDGDAEKDDRPFMSHTLESDLI